MSEPKVFISYPGDDAEWVRRFAEALREQHVDVWLDEWDVHAGDSILAAVEAGLRESDAIVAILSASDVQRPNVFLEFGFALGTGKRFIPIVPAEMDFSVLPFDIRARRFLTKGAPAEAAREVAEALRSIAA